MQKILIPFEKQKKIVNSIAGRKFPFENKKKKRKSFKQKNSWNCGRKFLKKQISIKFSLLFGKKIENFLRISIIFQINLEFFNNK